VVARKSLRTAIRKAKDGCWRELCKKAESDPWGKLYQIVMKKFGGNAARKASAGKEATIHFRRAQRGSQAVGQNASSHSPTCLQ